MLDKRKKVKPKLHVNDLVRTAGLKKTLSKGDTTKWSNKLYKITKIVNDSIPSYYIDNSRRLKRSIVEKDRVNKETK